MNHRLYSRKKLNCLYCEYNKTKNAGLTNPTLIAAMRGK